MDVGLIPIGLTGAADPSTYERLPFSGQSGLDTLSARCEFTAPNPGEFRAEVASVPLAQVTFDDFAATAHRCHRSTALIAAAPLDDIRMTYFYEGTFRARQGPNSGTFPKGSLAVVRTAREFGYVTTAWTRAISISIPVDLLLGEIKLIGPLLSAPLRPEPVVDALGEFVKSLGRGGPPRDGTPAGDFVSLALIDLARALIASQAGTTLAPEDAENGFRIRVRDYIVRNLSDPNLHPGSIASAFGIKVRYLHSLFETEEESVAQFVRHLRVEQASKAIRDSEEQISSIFDAVGFTSLDSAQRAFRSSMGMSASEYRASHRTFA